MAALGAFAWAIWVSGMFTLPGRAQPVVMIAAVVIGVGVWLRPAQSELALSALRRPTPRGLFWGTVGVAVLSSAYFLVTALVQDRYLGPRYHDDCVYLIQAQMLKAGRLWMPALPLGDFFDSFYLLTSPKYVAQYFPGAAMMYTPALWLGLPIWFMPLIVSGCAVGLMYCVVTKLLDGLAGALAVVMHVATLRVRQQSLAFTAQPAILFLSLLAVFLWLQWRPRRRLVWVALLGLTVGWAAITRPVDALCFAIPIALAMAFELRRASLREWLRTAAVGVLAVAPFLGVQIVLNLGTSGSATLSPFQIYAQRDNPGTMLGFHPYDPSMRPQSTLPQKRVFYDQWMAPYIRLHQPQVLWRTAWRDRLPFMVSSALPHPLLFALVPFGLIGGWRLHRAVLAGSLALFFGLYLLYTFFLGHYCLTAMPGLIFLCLLGLWRVLAVWRQQRRIAVPIAVLAVLVLCAAAIPQLNDYTSDPPESNSGIARVATSLTMVRQPAVVLFRFDPRAELHGEPVYNYDVAWPDDAPIIRAHDLGARNVEIFRYYANLQPERNFYLYDERTELLRPLGTARELAAIPDRPAPPAPRASADASENADLH